jgi:hypothetical protein
VETKKRTLRRRERSRDRKSVSIFTESENNGRKDLLKERKEGEKSDKSVKEIGTEIKRW